MTPEIRNHLSANSHLSKRRIIINNFFGGLSWGLGSALGATIILAGLIKILSAFPILNEVAKQLQK